MKTEGMEISIDRDMVFRMLDCKDGSPAYEDMAECYDRLLPEVMRRAQGCCIYGAGELAEADSTERYPAGTKVVYVISTVGKSLSALETELFEKEDYVGGMMADAMADACLFGLEKQWQEAVRCYCAAQGWGIAARLEAPTDLPMTVQKSALECLDAERELGMQISSGYMFYPVKSACQVLVISEDPARFQTQHDCRNCPQKGCRVRNVAPAQVTVRTRGGSKQILCMEGESILSAYRRQGGYTGAVCGGNGKCGKCRIRLVSGVLDITEADREQFSEKELAEGYRLSCLARPDSDCVIEEAFLDETGFQVVEGFVPKQDGSKTGREAVLDPGTVEAAGIAIDIGTTTMAAQLVDLGTGKILSSCSTINHQRVYGADVIARMDASNQGHGTELQRLVRDDIRYLVNTLLKQTNIVADLIKHVIIAGNTTMGHLLMGYSCETLGVYPFAPVNIGMIRDTYPKLMGSGELECEVTLMPGISAFVGGDIVSGLYACGFEAAGEVNLLVDLGTNGEMAIGSMERLLVTSTAAGPAFEGGNISCGTGSIPGAICHVRIAPDGGADYVTIGDKPPVGICGTGVIETTAELLRQELIDETGLLEEPYFEEGFPLAENPEGGKIVFTQKDVREIQLAKSAVRAGVETLMKRYGITCKEIAHVYLAGGFGFQMDREAAVTVGLLPEELKEKVTAVGNSSLAGAVRALMDPGWRQRQQQLIEAAAEVELSSDTDFNEFYMTYMMFGEA